MHCHQLLYTCIDIYKHRCEKEKDDFNSKGKCIEAAGFCKHAEKQLKKSHKTGHEVFLGYIKAQKKAREMRKKLKIVKRHHSWLKDRFKDECAKGKSNYFSNLY